MFGSVAVFTIFDKDVSSASTRIITFLLFRIIFLPSSAVTVVVVIVSAARTATITPANKNKDDDDDDDDDDAGRRCRNDEDTPLLSPLRIMVVCRTIIREL